MGKNIISFIIVLIGIIIFYKLIKVSYKLIFKIIINSVIGIILLFLTNLLGQYFNIVIGINLITILISGFCGIPGIIFLVLLKLFI